MSPRPDVHVIAFPFFRVLPGEYRRQRHTLHRVLHIFVAVFHGTWCLVHLCAPVSVWVRAHV